MTAALGIVPIVTISLSAFHSVLDGPMARTYPMNSDQRQAVDLPAGPLWLVAGPGSGKSEVLVTRTLRLLCVDGVPPASIMVTTFTVKAARNLEDRIAEYLSALKVICPGLQGIDASELRIGTLHSLCNDLLLEYRYAPYQNVRLLDDVEQNLFVYLRAAISSYDNIPFWTFFAYAVPRWRPGPYPPNKWQRAKAAVTLFNHLAEDRVDLALLAAAGVEWKTLADFYSQYCVELLAKYRCDFAHVQSRFLDFLSGPAGQSLIGPTDEPGDTLERPRLLHFLVDEYQDTNPLQEAIYLALAASPPHNLVVVGDDDQALYRFRGGSVACMVNFDRACVAAFGTSPVRIQLRDNYRSRDEIVDFFNGYIASHSVMKGPGVRAPGKSPVRASRILSGPRGVVRWLCTKRASALPGAVADMIQNDLMGGGVIADWSQCPILVRSAQESPKFAGPVAEELRRRGIPVYNPRSKRFMESEEVQSLLAVLVDVVDFPQSGLAPWHERQPSLSGQDFGWVEAVRDWRATLIGALGGPAVAPATDIWNYIARSVNALDAACAANPGQFLNLSLHEILYRILAREPFRTWRTDPVRNLRLSKVTRLFDSYHSFNLDGLRSHRSGGGLQDEFLSRFFWMFLCYLVDGRLDDDEDDDVVVPTGAVPILTIHQAKGLEFPFAVVMQLGQEGHVGAAQELEVALAPFRISAYPRYVRPLNDLVEEDDIRLFYVAYSRAEHGLVLAGTPAQLKDSIAIPNRDVVGFGRSIRIY